MIQTYIPELSDLKRSVQFKKTRVHNKISSKHCHRKADTEDTETDLKTWV